MCDTDQVIAEYDAAVPRYMKPTNMTSRQYADDTFAKSCRFADVYDGRSLNDVFIEDVNASVCHSFRYFLTQNPRSDLSDVAFQAESLLYIQKALAKPRTTIKVTKLRSSCLTEKLRLIAIRRT